SIAVRLGWQRIDWLSLAAWPAALLCFGRVFDGSAAPSSGFGLLGWLAPFAALCAFFRLRTARWPPAVAVLHAAASWLATALPRGEAVRRVDAAADGVWPLVAGIVTAAVMVAAIPFLRGRVEWPLAAHVRAYMGLGAGVIAALLGVMLVVANFASDGSAPPLAFVPLLNPLEIALIGAALALWYWARAAAALELGFAPTPWQRAVAVFAATWMIATMTAARAVHHWSGVPFVFPALADSSALQAALSLIWGLGACAPMLLGRRRGGRVLWFAGAALMAVVFVKLFVVDLANVGKVGRLVSFLGVGALLLGIGYFSPMPPRDNASRLDDAHDDGAEPAEPQASRG